MQANRRTSALEVRLRKALWTAGIRGYRVGLRLPGRPDVAFTRQRVAVFVHGCFWHQCPKGHLPPPRANAEFWKAKFRENRLRDERASASLTQQGWRVVTVWECDVRANLTDAVRHVRDALIID